jgi:hypothetical protein
LTFVKDYVTNLEAINQQQQPTQSSATFFVDQPNQMYEQHTFNSNQNQLNSVTHFQQQSNTNQILEMDWNDTDMIDFEIHKLFNEIDALNSY